MSASILLVDDNPDFLDLLSSLLDLSGLHVETADSGTQALRILNSSRPDLIVLDVQMPDMNGQEVLDHIEKKHQEVFKNSRIIFSSAGKPPLDPRVSGFIDKMTDIGDYLKQLEFYLGPKELWQATA
jgi:CheY-like chemotaxis protein